MYNDEYKSSYEWWFWVTWFGIDMVWLMYTCTSRWFLRYSSISFFCVSSIVRHSFKKIDFSDVIEESWAEVRLRTVKALAFSSVRLGKWFTLLKNESHLSWLKEQDIEITLDQSISNLYSVGGSGNRGIKFMRYPILWLISTSSNLNWK